MFYWPTFATSLDKPTFYVNNVRVRNDSIFGFQVLFEFDAFQLLGYERAATASSGTSTSTTSASAASASAPASSTTATRSSASPARRAAALDAWFINDDGLDNLGLGRRDIVPEEEFRGRTFWNHRQKLVGGWLDDWTVQGEVGWLSDRTFLEEYYENEWDNNKDQLTGVRLQAGLRQPVVLDRSQRPAQRLLHADAVAAARRFLLARRIAVRRPDDALLAHVGRVRQHRHRHAAVESRRCLSQWTLLPWEVDSLGNPTDAKGERFVTRNEIDYPIDVDAVQDRALRDGRVRPLGRRPRRQRHPAAVGPGRRAGQHSVLGRRSDDPRSAVQPQRPRAQGGVRRRGFVRRRRPELRPSSRSTTNSTTTRSRNSAAGCSSRRSAARPWPGQFNPKFDPRYWAIRSGMQDDVTATSMEMADDLAAVRVGHAASAADQARRAGRGADRRLDDVRLERHLVPRSEPRQLRPGHRADRLRLPLVHRRSLLDPLRRCGRHVWRRLQDRVARRHDQPAA